MRRRERGSRPDVAAAFGRVEFTSSGWVLTLNLTGLALSAGQHTVTAVALDSTGASGTLGIPILITVQ